ncbi:MAG: 50S ribosomal protein L24 [Coxiellaceae bacterium]|nr:50S ribosomal protein L24 [Coxiellaceae bacterium]
MKIKRDDMVIVIAGKDRGRTGRVMKLAANNRALVEGVNMVKKHVRPNPNKNEQGGIMDRESTVDLSNLAIYNPSTKKADRVGYKILEDGRKVRYFKSNGEVIDV